MRLFRKILFWVCFTIISLPASAQLPVCNGGPGGLIYFLKDDSLGYACIYNYDPALPFSALNPYLNMAMPPFPYSASGCGLAVSTNINGTGPSPTFYIADPNGYYHYYDGNSWVGTGHSTGNYLAVNPGAGGGFIYNVTGDGEVYKYHGSGDGTLLMTLSPWSLGGLGAIGGPWDMAADCEGNFYILRGMFPGQLEKYDPAGNQLQVWTIFPPQVIVGGGGSLAIIEDTVYSFGDAGGIWKGVLNGSMISFNFIPSNSPFGYIPVDAAACPLFIKPKASADTLYYCIGGSGAILNASGQPPYSWTILSGPAVIIGSGSSVTVTSTDDAVILGQASGGDCGPHLDTFRIIVPKVTIQIGPDDTLISCGNILKSLTAALIDTTLNLTYSKAWTPLFSIVSGANSLNPMVNPTSTTDFVLTVSTSAAQGGCSWADTVKITVVDSSVAAGFNYRIHYGCNGDTVIAENLSLNADSYTWDFLDATSLDQSTNPMHVYLNQSIYTLVMVASNGRCADTVRKTIDTQHPLIAGFTTNNDTICQGGQISFANTSVYTTNNGPVSYTWSFQDGSIDTATNTTHTFRMPGIYNVILTVRDFVPCMDTASRVITVDSHPVLSLAVSDSVVCDGQTITFKANYTHAGNSGLRWDFGDGTVPANGTDVIHAFDTSGSFVIKLDAHYRACPDTSALGAVQIEPLPVIDLGPDTFICPNSAPIIIADYNNQFNHLASWIWNTGDTGSEITARYPGIYTARVTINGCSTADSIEVFKDCYMDIPNSFTPNGDGLNDYFFSGALLTSGLTEFNMEIYNRWGQLIFKTNKIEGRGWDGKFNGTDQLDGVYIYLIEATIKNGQHEKYNGNLTLLR